MRRGATDGQGRMSESDSFIDEVNEEVRREKLYRTFRKYGWIGITAVVIIVGGAAFNEYRKATATAQAEALGDSILEALELPGAPVRVDALSNLPTEGDMQGVIALLTAAEQMAAEDAEAAVATLTPLASSSELPVVYSDLAAFKMILIGGESMTPELRAQLLDRLSGPGAPFRILAMEQKALDMAAAGESEAAIAAVEELMQEPQLTQSVVQRLTQLLLVLGAAPGDAAG